MARQGELVVIQAVIAAVRHADTYDDTKAIQQVIDTIREIERDRILTAFKEE